MKSTSIAMQMTWDRAVEILQDCKHPGQVGWRIARLLRISPRRVWEQALDVKYGLNLVSLLKRVVELKKRPQWVYFDRKGNVEAQW
jgi:hypothetical protein